ncbi:hypothetical protein COY95_03750, partial [Candidatus Woesearchaeota archaeon CG_4_10_14_0_8_um_filter_47_5]
AIAAFQEQYEPGYRLDEDILGQVLAINQKRRALDAAAGKDMALVANLVHLFGAQAFISPHREFQDFGAHLLRDYFSGPDRNERINAFLQRVAAGTPIEEDTAVLAALQRNASYLASHYPIPGGVVSRIGLGKIGKWSLDAALQDYAAAQQTQGAERLWKALPRRIRHMAEEMYTALGTEGLHNAVFRDAVVARAYSGLGVPFNQAVLVQGKPVRVFEYQAELARALDKAEGASRIGIGTVLGLVAAGAAVLVSAAGAMPSHADSAGQQGQYHAAATGNTAAMHAAPFFDMGPVMGGLPPSLGPSSGGDGGSGYFIGPVNTRDANPQAQGGYPPWFWWGGGWWNQGPTQPSTPPATATTVPTSTPTPSPTIRPPTDTPAPNTGGLNWN